IADISAGMYAYSGVLTALYQRERTGEGASFEVSLFESLGEWMGYPGYFTAYGGTAPPRTGSHHATIAPYGPFATSGGQVVFLGLQNEREWVRFCASVLNRSDLAHDARFGSNQGRVQHRVELESIIAETFSRLSAEEVLARLDAAEIANAQQRTPQEFWDHPQLAARNRWREVDSPVGMLQALLPPVTMDGVEPRTDRIPDVGEQTEEILGWLGYDAEQRAALRAVSAI
ncbi:MAG: CoA transferase, partial [Chloroflexota bacterium]|nr:CoA transferase [Chloroflexota bacterium]